MEAQASLVMRPSLTTTASRTIARNSAKNLLDCSVEASSGTTWPAAIRSDRTGLIFKRKLLPILGIILAAGPGAVCATLILIVIVVIIVGGGGFGWS